MNKQAKQFLKENAEFEKKLNDDSVKILRDIVVYLRRFDISEYHQEEIRRDIMQMVYDGEQRNETIENVIGYDYKSFCDEIINSMPKLTMKEKVITYSSYAFMFTSILSMWWIIIGILKRVIIEKAPFSTLPLTLANIINSVIIVTISIYFVDSVSKNSFETQEESLTLKVFFKYWVISVLIIGIILLIEYFISITLCNIPIYFGIILIIVPIIAKHFLENSFRY